MESKWAEKWESLNGGEGGWEELCKRAESTDNIKPFSMEIPSSMEAVADLVMGWSGWVAGTDYPAEAVAETSPSGLLLQSERSVSWLVRLNPSALLDLGLSKPGSRSRIWECLPPLQWTATRHWSVETEDEGNGLSCLNCARLQRSNLSTTDVILVLHEKMCIGQGIKRQLFHVEEKKDGKTSLSPYALFFAFYPPGTEPSPWPLTTTMNKKESIDKALRMRPSRLSSVVHKVASTRSLSQAKQQYRDERGGAENLEPGDQISQQALKKDWQRLRETENLPRLGRGGVKGGLDDEKLRASLNRNADFVLLSQLEINPKEDIDLRVALRHPLAKDDLIRCCLNKSSSTFRSGIQVDTTFGDFYLTGLVCEDQLFRNREDSARSTPLLFVLHDRRTMADYLWMGQALGTLSKLSPRQQRENPVTAVATDGDSALVDGLLASCPLLEGAAHSGCHNHMTENIKTAIRTKFPALLACQGQLITAILGAEVADGRCEGAVKKRARLTGLVDCVSTNLRSDWDSLREELEKDVSAWGPAEETDSRLSAFLGFADYAEEHWLQSWDTSFCMDSRQRFHTALGSTVIGKVLTNRIEGVWPELHLALKGHRGLHEIVDKVCGFLRSHYEDKKEAIMGMETDHVKVHSERRERYVLPTAAWVGPDRERCKARALARVWPSLARTEGDSGPTSSQSQPLSAGGLDFDEQSNLLISATAFPFPLFSVEEAKALDRTADSLLSAGALTKVSDSFLTLLEPEQPPCFIEVCAKAPLLKCRCNSCKSKSAPYSAVTSHTIAAAHLLGAEFASTFKNETLAWLGEKRKTERASLVSPDKGTEGGPMSRRRHGEDQSRLAPPDRLLNAGPAQITLHEVTAFIKAMPAYLPTSYELRNLASGSVGLYDPAVHKHHNNEPVYLIRVQDCTNSIFSNFRDRDCTACLRRLITGTEEPGDLVAMHTERMHQRVDSESGSATKPPPLPPADTLGVGKRWERYERALEMEAGYKYSRPSVRYERALEMEAGYKYSRPSVRYERALEMEAGYKYSRPSVRYERALEMEAGYKYSRPSVRYERALEMEAGYKYSRPSVRYERALEMEAGYKYSRPSVRYERALEMEAGYKYSRPSVRYERALEMEAGYKYSRPSVRYERALEMEAGYKYSRPSVRYERALEMEAGYKYSRPSVRYERALEMEAGYKYSRPSVRYERALEMEAGYKYSRPSVRYERALEMEAGYKYSRPSVRYERALEMEAGYKYSRPSVRYERALEMEAGYKYSRPSVRYERALEMEAGYKYSRPSVRYERALEMEAGYKYSRPSVRYERALEMEAGYKYSRPSVRYERALEMEAGYKYSRPSVRYERALEMEAGYKYSRPSVRYERALEMEAGYKYSRPSVRYERALEMEAGYKYSRPSVRYERALEMEAGYKYSRPSVRYERALEMEAGYKYSRPSVRYNRGYHATYSCLLARFPHLQRSQLSLHPRL